jgi:hypothetical protein
VADEFDLMLELFVLAFISDDDDVAMATALLFEELALLAPTGAADEFGLLSVFFFLFIDSLVGVIDRGADI